MTLLAPLSLTADAGWATDPTGHEEGTLALWKFDTPDDPGANSAIAHTASLTFSTTGTETGAGVPGKFGTAFRSLPSSNPDGSSDKNTSFAEAKNSADLFSEHLLTVDFWFLPETETPRGTFFDKKRTDPTGLRLFSSSNDSLALEVGNGERSQTLVIPKVTWTPGRWVHIAVTFENKEDTAHLRIYRDGALLGERLLPGFGNLASGRHPWRIGNRRVAAYASMPGSYDNFRISSLSFQP